MVAKNRLLATTGLLRSLVFESLRFIIRDGVVPFPTRPIRGEEPVMPNTANSMDVLYRRLGEVGLKKKFLRSTILPSWWDDQVAENPAGYAQAIMLLSHHLGLDLRALFDPTAAIKPKESGPCNFKKRVNTTRDELGIAQALATRAAQFAAGAFPRSLLNLPEHGLQVRREILGVSQPWVDLKNLVDYCWSVGVPVIHLGSLPPGGKKPDGLVTVVKGRPVIVLCRATKSAAKLLFILAHELGHVVLKHVQDNSTLVDEKVNRSNKVDQEEVDADAFALTVLTGDADSRINHVGRWPAAEGLAEEARKWGASAKIDPGHVVLNFACTADKYPLAVAALRFLEGQADARKMIRDRMVAELDWSLLPEDSSEFLTRVVRV